MVKKRQKKPKGEFVSKRKMLILVIEVGILIFIVTANIDAIATNEQINVIASNIQTSDKLKELVIQELHQMCIPGDNMTAADFDEHFDYYCGDLAPMAVYEYLVENVSMNDDSFWEGALNLDNDPESTLTEGGDCENFAILALSMLKSYGYTGKLYLVFQPGHACWMVDHSLYGCSDELPIIEVKYIGGM